MKQARYKEPLPLAVIEAARAGDAGAVEQVLQYYNGYINKLCNGRCVQDGAGEENDHIDQGQQDNGNDVLDFQFIGVCSTHG